MLNTIENSEVFKKEFRMFNERISAIQDEQTKKDLTTKLNDLLREVRHIDNQHVDIFNKNIATTVHESRSKLAELRKYIDRKLKELS